jgi:TetR/AcrR family transcriptional repressor of bet genes
MLAVQHLYKKAMMTKAAAQKKIRRTHSETREFRQNTLLRAALVTVAKFDIEAATIARICAEAGASRGLITHYFESKQALLVAALSSLFDEAQALKESIATDPDLTAVERIRRIAYSSFQAPIYSWEMAAAWQAFSNSSRYNPVYKAPLQLSAQKFSDTVVPLFDLIELQQQLRLDAIAAARGLYVLISGLWNSMACDEDGIKPQEAMMQCDVYIEGCFK